MKNTMLVLIEGIPGSGKTSTARHAKEMLEKRGVKPMLFLEGDWDHPADFESVACLDPYQVVEIEERFPTAAPMVETWGWVEDTETFIPYRKLEHEQGANIPDGLIQELAAYEIYDLPPSRHIRLLQKRWLKFAHQAYVDEHTYIFECCFLQNPVTTLLARHDLPLADVFRHIQTLCDYTAPLNPRLVYLHKSDVRAGLEKAREERPQQWAEYVTWYLTSQNYGKRRGLRGFEGVILFYEERQQMELDLLQRLPIQSLVVRDNQPWENRYRQIEMFLSD